MSGPVPSSTAATSAEALWTQISGDLRRFIARRAPSDDVDDLLQTVFLRLHARLASVREDDRLLSWVYTVTRNVITDHYRLASNRRELAVGEMPPALHPLIEHEDDETAEAELAGCLRPMLARLPPDQAVALEMVELEGRTQVDAAHVAGVTISGMKSRVQRGRAHLRRLLLDCCHVERDVRGRVQDWQPRDPSCRCR